MAVTPTGVMSLPLANLEIIIANSSAFQAWAGAADDVAAKDNIHLVNVPDAVLVRPFALVGFADKWKAQKTAEFFHEKRGELFLMFESDVLLANQASEADAVFAFMNVVGAVISEVLALAGTNGFLNVTEVEMTTNPMRITDEDAQMLDDYYTVEFSVIWDGF